MRLSLLLIFCSCVLPAAKLPPNIVSPFSHQIWTQSYTALEKWLFLKMSPLILRRSGSVGSFMCASYNVALYSPKRTEMGVLVVSGRRLNRLIGRIHSNQTFHKQAQSSSIRGTILQRTFYSQPQSDAYSQGTYGSKAPVSPPITSQLGQLFEEMEHFFLYFRN